MDEKNYLRPIQSQSKPNGKRTTMKSEKTKGDQNQITRQRSELNKNNADEQCKEQSTSAYEINKGVPQIKKTRSDSSKQLSVSVYGSDKSPVHKMKTRSASQMGSNGISNASQKSPTALRKVKSEADKALNDEKNHPELRKIKSESNKSVDGNAENSLQLVRAKSVSIHGSNKNLENQIKPSKEIPIEIKSKKAGESCKDLVVYEEKVITRNFSNADESKSKSKFEEHDDNEDEVEEKELDDETEVEIEKQSLVVKEISIAEESTNKIVIQEKKHQHSNERSVPMSPIGKKKHFPVVNNVTIRPSSTPVSEEFHGNPTTTHSKLQSIVDLVMWKDVSKSALIFGIGTFFIISSSYTQDVNISLISVVSYLSLVYLAAIFLFKSLICRGATDMGNSNQDQVFGEEEAVWLMKMIVPYVNEFLLNIKSLFSGEPATTMKMAVVLFVLARCGSSITIWKMARLGFFGVFMVPKACSSYSKQMTAFATFWVRRIRDAWDSCSHKKAVAFGIFTLVWNLSSVVARIWAAFMLFVAFKYYQQSMAIEGWTGVEASEEDSWHGQIEKHRKQRRSVIMETRKQKKAF